MFWKMEKLQKEQLKELAKKDIDIFLKKLEIELVRSSISIPQFAKLIGVSREAVYQWFSGKSIMNLERYYRILEVLGEDFLKV